MSRLLDKTVYLVRNSWGSYCVQGEPADPAAEYLIDVAHLHVEFIAPDEDHDFRPEFAAKKLSSLEHKLLLLKDQVGKIEEEIKDQRSLVVL